MERAAGPADRTAQPGQTAQLGPNVPLGLVAESIDGSGVRVRRYRDDDAADVAAGCADPLTQRFLPLLPSPYTRADAVWWITEGSRAAFDTGGGNFAIADPATDRLLGGIGVTHQRDGNGEIGYWVAPWARGRGVATAATRTLSGYAFSAGYARLQLRTEYENTLSQRVALASGYTREGVQRGVALSRGGGRHDLVVWVRLAGDPPGPAPRALPDLPGGHLTDGTVVLTPLGPEDAAVLHALRTVPDVLAAAGAAVPPSLAQVEQICARAGAQWLAGTHAHLAIRDPGTGAMAGHIGLFDIMPRTGTASIGYDVAPAWRGRGYAARAVRLLARWVLRAAGFARLDAGTAPDNTASQRVLEKAGFIREGHRRGYLPDSRGGRADLVSYALLATDLTAAD